VLTEVVTHFPVVTCAIDRFRRADGRGTTISVGTRTTKTLALAMLTLIAVGASSARSSADTGIGGGELSAPAIGVGLLVVTEDADGSRAMYAGGDPAAPSPIRYRYEPYLPAFPGDIGAFCSTPDGEGPPGSANGWLFSVVAYERATDRELGPVGTLCAPFEPGGGIPTPPTLPEPPSIAMIWDAAGLPAPHVAASPRRRGVTGLESWFWTSAPAPVAVGVDLAGFRISGTAVPIEHRFYADDDGWSRRATSGSPNAPAVVRTFERTKTARIGVATVWRGDVTMQAPGLAPVDADLGFAIVRTGVDYPVDEIRSVLR
jgi:hypothetical protein